MQHFTAAAAAAVCQQGIPTFVSVINTGHLVASSGLSLRLDFDIKTLAEFFREELPGFSFSSSRRYDKCY